MTRPVPDGRAGHLLQEAAAPLLLLAAIGAGGLVILDVWAAAGLATGVWPDLSPALLDAMIRGGPTAVLGPGVPTGAFTAVLAALAAVETLVVVVVAVLMTRGSRVGDPRRSLLTRPVNRPGWRRGS